MHWTRNIVIALGIAGAAAGIGGTANAQPADYRHHGANHVNYGHDGHHGDNRNWNRGRHNGWNNHRHCTTEWRHHQRVRRCR